MAKRKSEKNRIPEIKLPAFPKPPKPPKPDPDHCDNCKKDCILKDVRGKCIFHERETD